MQLKQYRYVACRSNDEWIFLSIFARVQSVGSWHHYKIDCWAILKPFESAPGARRTNIYILAWAVATLIDQKNEKLEES